MTQVYRTLRVAPSDEGVLGVVIDAPPMNLIGPELVRDLVGLLGELAVGWCEPAPRAELGSPGRYRAPGWVRSRLTWGPGSGIPLTFPSHAW
jgi:hypothetical protein